MVPQNYLVNGLGGAVGFGENTLPANDDGYTAAIDITSVFSGGLNFFGHTYNEIYVNNNGNVTFGTSLSTYTPFGITTSSTPIIAPYFADVDTNGDASALSPTSGGHSAGTNLVYYDLDTTHHVFTVTWDDVGYFNSKVDLRNAFQLQLVDKGGGNFDIVFRYEDIQWTTGDASGGTGGLGGTPARAGYSAGDQTNFYELSQSGDQAGLLSLESTPGDTGVNGYYQFEVRNGQPLLPWNFSYSQPHDILLFAHLSVDAYNGTGSAANSHTVHAPQGWTPILTTADGSSPASIDAATSGHIAVFNTSSNSPHMQATAYREDATGRVVIAYRGTDDGNSLLGPPNGELLDTSIPLGAGLAENAIPGVHVHTVSYLQSAVDFYAAVVDSGIDSSMISFTGHSLGGIVAGYMAGVTASQGMIFASGPQNILVRDLDHLVAKPDNHGFLAGAPDFSELVSTRVNGEVLGAAVDAARKGVLYSFALSTIAAVSTGFNAFDVLSDLSGYVVKRWGNAKVEGTHLHTLSAGPDNGLGAVDLHSMALHELILYGDYGLGLHAYKKVPGFIDAFYDASLTRSAEKVAGPDLFDHSASHMRTDMVLAVQDGRENVLQPLLTDAENVLAPLKTIYFGLIDSTGSTGSFLAALSDHFVEMAARALISDSVSYAAALGRSQAGVNLDWLSLALDSFGTGTPSEGVREMADLVLQLIGRAPTRALHFIPLPGDSHYKALVNGAQNLYLIDNADGLGSLHTTDANDFAIGAVMSDGRGVSVNGSGGNDVLIGSLTDDVLQGGAGDNLLAALVGDDMYVASGVADAHTTISDLGGDDTLVVGGEITGYGKESYRYLNNTLSLSLGTNGASVDILDYYNGLDFAGVGRIEHIQDIHGDNWQPATMLENAAHVVTHKVHSVVATGVNVLVTTASDSVDKIVGAIGDFAARQVHVVGFGVEDVLRIAGTLLQPSMLHISTGSIIADIDTNLDGMIDASFTLEGDYTGYQLVMGTNGGDTTFHIVGDPDVVYDLHGSDGVDDTITGTAAGERIGGLGGNDLLHGKGGSDHLDGGDGNDTLDGGGGGDVMRGGKGNDHYIVNSAQDVVIEFNGEGNDAVRSLVSFTLATQIETLTLAGSHAINGAGNSLNNKITGNAAANYLSGGTGKDTLNGADGNDTIDGGGGADRIDGGGGRDTADYAASAAGVLVSLLSGHGSHGAAAGDTLLAIENLAGSTHNDSLTGDGARNVLSGDAGNDRLDGGGGADKLIGGDGRDIMVGGQGSDTVDGGDGIDTADYSTSPKAVNIDLGTGKAIGGYAAGDVLIAVENLTGSSGNDTLTGDGNANSLSGGGGKDKLSGALGNDTLNGGNGSDKLLGGGGNDKLEGDAGADTLTGNAGNDNLSGGSQGDRLHGNGGNDKLQGGSGADILNGDAGKDHLFGNGGNDVLNGGAANDTLEGGDGDDKLSGGSGADLLSGGSGDDNFIFAGAFGHDIITDFAKGNHEHIDLAHVSGIHNFADLIAHHLTTDPSGSGFALINDGAGDTILLDGVTVSEIGVGQAYSGADFLF